MYILWDATQFYDSVDLGVLLHTCLKQGLDELDTMLALEVYLAPRRVVMAGLCSEKVVIGNGVVAGCVRGNFYARILLHSLLENMHAVIPKAAPRSFVDDLVQLICGETKEVIGLAAISATAVVRGLQALKITISKKSVLVGDCVRTAKLAAVAIKTKCGFVLRTARVAADLGVDCGGRRRTCAKRKVRVKKSTKRVLNIRWMSRKVRQAARLYTQGARPQRTYGAVAYGVAPTEMHQERMAAATATGLNASACTTTAIALVLGMANDPAVTSRVAQLKMWAELYLVLGVEEQAKVKQQWFQAAKALSKEGWRGVCGPMSATIMVLSSIGWRPIGPDIWRDDNGRLWELRGDGKGHAGTQWELADAVQASVARMLWKGAARHYGGAGLQEGADLLDVTRHVAYYRKQGLEREARVLETVVCGGAWFGDRYIGAGRPEMQYCRCGAEQTAMHAIWLCPLLDCIDDERIQQSQKLAQRVRANTPSCEDMSCYWTRGIPRINDCTVPEFHGEAWRWTWGNAHLWKDSSARVIRASDGSGGDGDGSKNPRTRRVGWSAVVEKFDDTLQACDAAASCGGIDGRQTVPRAEARGFTEHAAQAPCGSSVIDLVDATYVSQGVQRLDSLVQGRNGDIWERLVNTQKLRKVNVVPVKIKSHASVDHIVESGCSVLHLVANEYADVFADWAAQQMQMWSSELIPWCMQMAEAWRVRERLLAVAMLHDTCGDDRKRNTKLRRAAQKQLAVERRARAKANRDEAIPSTNHSLVFVRFGIFCSLCRDGGRAGRANLDAFVRTPCPFRESARAQKRQADVIDAQADEPARRIVRRRLYYKKRSHAFDPPIFVVATDQVGWRPAWLIERPVFAGIRLHGSHGITILRGIMWCYRCGAYAEQNPIALKEVCPGTPPSRRRRDCLSRMRKGLHPIPGQSWMEAASTVLADCAASVAETEPVAMAPVSPVAEVSSSHDSQAGAEDVFGFAPLGLDDPGD